MRQVLSPATLSQLLQPTADTGRHLTLIVSLDGVLERRKQPEQPRVLRRGLAGYILSVLGSETLRAKDIIERLRVRGGLPGGKDPAKTVATVLGQRNDLFERVSRGIYRARRESHPAG